MSDITTPLVLSIVSLGATIVTTLIGAYITYYSDERKARRDANKILLKYRDPLLLAAQDLQARCFGICNMDLLEFRYKDKPARDGEVQDTTYHDTLYIYTAYVVGQYLSWSWIIRRQAQFVALVSSSPPARWNPFRRTSALNSSLMQKMENIKAAFNHSDRFEDDNEKAFLMFKAHQQSVGEIMSCQDKNGEYYCMGYATFTERWKAGHPENLDYDTKQHKAGKVDHTADHIGEGMAGISKVSDQSFRAQFRCIEEGINFMYDQRAKYKETGETKLPINYGADGRLRRLQHLLLDLITHLDTSNSMKNPDEASPIRPAAPNCTCSLHPCHCKPDCKDCIRNQRFTISIFGTVKKCPCADRTCHVRCRCKHCKDQARGASRPNMRESYGNGTAYRPHSMQDTTGGATRRSGASYNTPGDAV